MRANSTDLKIVLLGNKNVGKTSIINRYCYDEFGPTSMTIGAYFAIKQTLYNNRYWNCAVWDTAGEEKFDSLTSFYCRGAQAAVVCFDLTSRDSFEHLERWVTKIRKEAHDDCVIILCGNKMDIVEKNPSRRAVPTDQVEEYAENIKAVFLQASAKTGHNVTCLFSKAVQVAVDRNLVKVPDITKSPVVDITSSASNSFTSCC